MADGQRLLLHRKGYEVSAHRYRHGAAFNARSQPHSNGMAEAFVKTFKRDYVSVNPLPDAVTVIAQLPSWFEHYNALHPHKALGYRSPREFLDRQTET